MPVITIASYIEARDLLEQASDNFAHVVSINDPNHEPPTPLASHAARRLVLHFYDIMKPTLNWDVPPTEADVARVIEFAEGIVSGDKVLVHCAAGISRSSAAALTILASKEDRTPEGAAIAYAKTHRAKAEIWPNATMVRLADQLLGFGRGLVDVHLKHRPRDADYFSGYP